MPTRCHEISDDWETIEDLFVDLFLEAHKKPPEQIILDVDATDNPLHGNPEGKFFHALYDTYCVSVKPTTPSSDATRR